MYERCGVPRGHLTTVGVTAAVLALASCTGGEPTGSTTSVASISVTPGSGSVASLGAVVSFAATARDASGNAVPGVTFTWTSSVPGVVTVDGAGVAEAVGNGSAQIRASAEGVTGSASLTVAQEPGELSLVSGDAQAATVREALSVPLRVRVLDARSNAIEGLDLTWEVLTGGGSIGGSPTDATGTASATWTLGSTPGPATARARAGGLQITFTADALANGIIQGTVTDQPAYLSPPRAARMVSARVGRLEEGAGPGAGSKAAPTTLSPARPEAPAVRAGRLEPVPGELLVRLRTHRVGMPAAGSQALRRRAQAEDAARLMRQAASRWQDEEALETAGASPVLATVRVRVPPGQEEAVRQRLLRRPEVESVERNERVWGTYAVPPRTPRLLPHGAGHAPAAATSEPYFTRQAWHYDAIDAFRAWEVTTGSSDVIVAVVDDGIRFDHPDIAANLRADGYDFVTFQEVPGCTSGTFSTTMDGDGPDPDPTMPASLVYDLNFGCVVGEAQAGNHGLHVAGTVGARAGNGGGGVGVAWEVGIRPVRVLGSTGFGSWYDIAQGILYAAGLPADDGAGGLAQAAQGAHVINLSLGGSGASAVIQDAVEAATDAGSLLIAAAGNSASSLPFYPASYPDVLSVSSVAPDLSLASYSNFGSTVDIAAPGGETASGSDHGVWSLVWGFQSGTPAYGGWQGTSMAAPHVSGVAALVLAASPGLDVAQLRARLVDHAIDLGATGPDDLFGAGLVHANGSVRNGVGAPRDAYVWAFDAQGAAHGPVQAAADGSYSITPLDDGEYTVYAGHDRNGDGLTGFFDRGWGAFGGSTTPTSVVIEGSSVETASFDFGLPVESEANGTLDTADPLPLGGYAYGSVDSSSDVDLFRVDLSAPTSVVVETDAAIGACGLVEQVDTFVRLLDDAGIMLAENDDVDAQLLRRCSRIEMDLPAGTYFVEVTGWNGDVGYYGVRVAKGS